MNLKYIFERLGTAPAKQTREELSFRKLTRTAEDELRISLKEKYGSPPLAVASGAIKEDIERGLNRIYLTVITEEQAKYDNLTIEEKVYNKLADPFFPPFWINPDGGLYPYEEETNVEPI